MADPITIVGAIASVVQLIDFSTRVLIRLNEYQSNHKELPSAFAHIASQHPILREILEKSKDGMYHQSISPDEVQTIEPCLRGCQQQVEKLDGILSAVLPDAREGRVKRMTKGFRSLWEESDVRKIDAEIESYVNRLTFYCAWSSSKLDPRNKDTLARLQKWLAPPDPLFNPRKALKLRSANTGKWYLQGARYEAWKTTGPPYTWLYGSAGSGKTILSTGIIEDLQEYCRDDPARSLAVYFFDFNDVDKQDPSKMCVTRRKVRRALRDLPKTLDNTYARILSRIDEGQNAEEALKILRSLAYAERPLTANEVLEVTGILTEKDSSHFDEDEVLRDSRDSLRICFSLVSITSSGDGANVFYDDMEDESV
ncbi:hypothetical protein LTR54_018228 [Friedmanniomyces endolithicus]|nr:hypothetical protein LTR54_018228 [Friedmanniomyces endolithicus]